LAHSARGFWEERKGIASVSAPQLPSLGVLISVQKRDGIQTLSIQILKVTSYEQREAN
jgi:hypothetical protein